MRSQKDRHLLGLVQVPDVRPQLIATLRVKAEGWFIQKEDFCRDEKKIKSKLKKKISLT